MIPGFETGWPEKAVLQKTLPKYLQDSLKHFWTIEKQVCLDFQGIYFPKSLKQSTKFHL